MQRVSSSESDRSVSPQCMHDSISGGNDAGPRSHDIFGAFDGNVRGSFLHYAGIEESNQRLSLCAHVSRRKWHPYSEYFTLDWPVSVLLCLLALIQLTEANELQFSITLHF